MSDQGNPAGAREYWVNRLVAMTRASRQRDLLLQLGLPYGLIDDEFQLGLSDLKAIRELTDGENNGIYHQAIDHFLRSRVEPAQTILATWMNGAKAHIDDVEVPFNQVVTRCQDMHDREARSLLTREVRALCRFLVPFNHTTWKILLDILEEELGYQDYINFCEEKRNISLAGAAEKAKSFLEETREPYRELLQPLLRKITNLDLEQASRFDGIYLMGLRYLDHHFPEDFHTADILDFLCGIGYTLVSDPARLIIHENNVPVTHPYCIPIYIPEEIHVIVGSVRGWLDLEALCHELGHAMTFLYTDPELVPEQVDFFQSGAVTESFAFLFQRMSMSPGFLHDVLGLAPDVASMVSATHKIKWLTLARRYAAKLVIEVENFQRGYLQRGEKYYADTMQKETGFFYDPETYLFDLMPDFYSLDYFQAFLGAASLEEYLQHSFGDHWYSASAAVTHMQGWWREGARPDLSLFLKEKTGRPLQQEQFVKNYSA